MKGLLDPVRVGATKSRSNSNIIGRRRQALEKIVAIVPAPQGSQSAGGRDSARPTSVRWERNAKRGRESMKSTPDRWHVGFSEKLTFFTCQLPEWDEPFAFYRRAESTREPPLDQRREGPFNFHVTSEGSPQKNWIGRTYGTGKAPECIIPVEGGGRKDGDDWQAKRSARPSSAWTGPAA